MNRHTVLAILSGLPLLHAGSAIADRECAGSIGALTIDDNLIVNGYCELNRTTVKGNVLIQNQGNLIMREAVVDGNVQASGGFAVRVLYSRIDGDIQLDALYGDQSSVEHSSVKGNIQLNDNGTNLLTEYNVIDGDLQAFGNRGQVRIRYNTIDGNLQCKSNVPDPSGGFNQVSGNKEDQCARLDEVAVSPPVANCPVAAFDSATGQASIHCIIVDGATSNQLDVELGQPYRILSLIPRPDASSCQQPSFDSASGRATIPCLRLDGDPAQQYSVELEPPYNIRGLKAR